MPWENGVSTTQWMSGKSALMERATENASLSALPGRSPSPHWWFQAPWPPPRLSTLGWTWEDSAGRVRCIRCIFFPPRARRLRAWKRRRDWPRWARCRCGVSLSWWTSRLSDKTCSTPVVFSFPWAVVSFVIEPARMGERAVFFAKIVQMSENTKWTPFIFIFRMQPYLMKR